MPANVLAEMNDHAVMWLIQAIPKKVSAIVDELLAGEIHRTNFRKGPVMNWFSRSERENGHKIAKGFSVAEACTSCGWCVRNCPTRNIEITESGGKPQFLDQCVFCTRCLNGCPVGAIKAKGPFQLKNSLDMDAVERRMEGLSSIRWKSAARAWCSKGSEITCWINIDVASATFFTIQSIPPFYGLQRVRCKPHKNLQY
jgi:formate hydrogenlyase subunit 6/NADH:ubiquinone oxidoreductase subunit I